MRNTCKNHRAGKIGFPSKSSSQVRGCLSPTAIIRLDVFSLLLSLTPSPALSARYPLPALGTLVSRGFCKHWLRAGGGRSGQSPAVCRCCSALCNCCEPSGQAAALRWRPARLRWMSSQPRSARARRAPRTRPSGANLTHKCTAESQCSPPEL